MKRSKLGKKQERFPEVVTLREHYFAQLVARGVPARQAYRLAGFEGTATSQRANAPRLEKKPNVAALIASLVAEQTTRVMAAGEEELTRLEEVMSFNALQLYDDAGRLIPIHQLEPRVAAVIKTIRPGRYGTVYEFHDKLRAIEIRLKAFGRLKDTVKLETTLEEIVAGAKPEGSR